jgi:hypothetical protein
VVQPRGLAPFRDLDNIEAAARDNLAAVMTPDQVAEVQQLAPEWQAKHSTAPK